MCTFSVYYNPRAKTIKKNTNSTQNKSQTHNAKAYKVTSFLSTDCELSTETCSKNVYSLGPWSLTSQNNLLHRQVPVTSCLLLCCSGKHRGCLSVSNQSDYTQGSGCLFLNDDGMTSSMLKTCLC